MGGGGRVTHHRIISPANASLDIYPNNFLSAFTHRLPNPITIPSGQIATVALTSLVIPTSLDGDKRPEDIGYIKVHLQQLLPQYNPDPEDVRVLSRTNLVQGKKGRSLLWFVEKNPIHLPLDVAGRLEELSFRITDENNAPLPLDEGPATVVHLDMHIGSSTNNFSLCVNAHTSCDLYPDNTTSHWRVELPKSLRLDPSWEVALHGVHVPKSLRLGNYHHMTIMMHRRKHFFEGSGIFKPSSATTIFTVEIDATVKLKSFITNQLNPVLNAHGFSAAIVGRGEIQITRTKEVDMANTDQELILIVFDYAACTALGIEAVSELGAAFPLPHQVATPVTVREAHPSETGKHKTRLQFTGPEHLLVYTNMVEPSIIGNAAAPFLDMVDVREVGLLKTSTETFHTINQRVFCGISPRMSSTMEVKFTSLSGEEIQLTSTKLKRKRAEKIDEGEGGGNIKGQEVMSLVLVFRKQGAQ